LPGVNPDAFRLGPISQAVKRKATKKQWKRIVTDAHAKGFAVESYLDRSVPNEYKARTRESLKKQATTTLTEAYKPAEKLLNERETRINALAGKRKQDNEFYLDWLTKSRGNMQVSANAATETLRASAQKIHDDAKAAHEASIQQGADRLMQQPGNVTAREELVKQLEISPDNIRRLELINNQRQQIESNAANTQKHMAAQDANVIAQQAAVQAQQASEAWKALTEAADDKLKIQMEKGSAIADEIQRLLGQEIDKAGANRDFAAVTEKLGIQGETLDLKKIIEASKAADRDADNSRADDALAETQRRNAALEEIANAKLDQGAERIKLGWYSAKKRAYESSRKSKGGKGPKYEDTAEGRYNTYYAKLAGYRFKDGRPLRPSDVSKNPISWQNKLIAEGLTPVMAQRVIKAFIGGRAPGDKAGAPPAFKVGDPKPRT